jgi:hypothetical protein
MSTATNLYIGVDTVVTYGGMQNPITAAYINDATVTCTIKDLTGTAVTPTGFTWPVTLAYVAASDGIYRGTIDKNIAITAGISYWLEITAVSGSLNDFRRLALVGAYREAT